MKKSIKIFTILLLAGLVSACAKDELEEPSQPSAIEATDLVKHQQDLGFTEADGIDYPSSSSPAAINDDGDDEDEDRTLVTVE